MKSNRCCIIQCFDREKDKPSICDVVKVFYKDKYIDKYSKLIDKDKLYPMDEAK